VDAITGTAILEGDAMSLQRKLEPHLMGNRPASISLQLEDLSTDEIGVLLEDIRIGLDRDLNTATRAVGRLAALIAGKAREDVRSGHVRGGLAAWQVRKVQAYIEVQLEETLLVEDLAALVLLSVSHFGRSFRESFGETPHAYIMRTRVARARRLMLTTSESLIEIALACGFADQAHLCRFFRRVTGVTPGVWRRCHAGGPPASSMVRSKLSHSERHL
jgi:AraC family transcriptional regulator